LGGAEIEWEMRGQWMQYSIETSSNGKNWTKALDASKNTTGGTRRDKFSATDVRFIKLNIIGQQNKLWPSLWEVRLYDQNDKQVRLFPRVEQQTAPVAKTSTKEDPYQKSGNYKPHPHRLNAEDEAKLLKDVSVPEGFTASLFAPWQMANYPTYLAAAPNGDLYVSSDGNASGGRQPGRGRVLRLRDTDNDGRADEVTEFVRDVDSPRGLLWDHDRLYLLHPPHITVYHDVDGDGVADSSKRLISDIAFGFKDRAADHTTNGLEMGPDGWIYIAVGDFGFMNATGTDGRTLQMRGGGVVRFRPDGSGMETFSDGTRNTYGIAITPTLDFFARDNTNDGGGWNVRLHHLSGLEDHGYPRLYMNFADETVAPLADYGGGSGVGAFYLGEPGIPAAWNNRPYTCDWGRQGSYRHILEPHGATFKETAKPEILIKMSRPTDADVDGLSNIYQASWIGPANFTWKGPEQGYIARVSPTGYQPSPLPDFAKLSDAQLVEIIRTSPSHVRSLAAQRTLLRRPANVETNKALLMSAQDRSLDIGKRILALYAITQRGLDSRHSQKVLDLILPAFSSSPANDPIIAFVTRALGDLAIDTRTTGQPGPTSNEFLKKQLHAKQPRAIIEAIIATTFQGKAELATDIARHLDSEDALIRHTAYRALAKLDAHEVALTKLKSDQPAVRTAAARALMRMHIKEVVDVLIARLSTQTDPSKRQSILAVLARLYQREGKWTGDSWSTRPDTRGPYYQPETWQQSARILEALNGVLENPATTKEENSTLVSLLGKNRIQNNRGLQRIITLAKNDSSLLPTLLGQLADKENIPSEAIPLIIQAAKNTKNPAETHKVAIPILLTLNHPEAFDALMSSLEALMNDSKASKIRDDIRQHLMASPQLENYVERFIPIYQQSPESAKGRWAAQALLQLASGKNIGIEARESSRKAIDSTWPVNNQYKHTLMEAAFWTKIAYLNDHISLMLSSADAGLKRRATGAAGRLGIQAPGVDKTPKISSLKPDEAVTQILNHKKGNTVLGEAIFARATCNACHTVSADEPPKGPYLGSIANILRPQDLAEAIILPNKAIAQGFKTNLINLKSGAVHMGFVTDEAGETVTVRDITSKKTTFNKSDISSRNTLPNSLMPAGLMNSFTVHETASLLSYITGLAK
jgi:putative membrane-bound dehydrogenase-like protein